MMIPLLETTTDSQRPTDLPDVSGRTLIDEIQAILVTPDSEGRWLSLLAGLVSVHIDAPIVRLWALSSDGSRLHLRTAVGLDVPFDALQDNIPVKDSELGHVVTGGVPYLASCADQDAPPDVRQWAHRAEVTSFFALPIFSGGRAWGVMGLFTRVPLDPSRCDLLAEIAALIGRGIAGASDVSATTAQAKSADLLSSLMPCLSSAIVTLDHRGMVTHWNGKAESLFGWGQKDVLHKPLPIVPQERRHEFASLDATGETSTRVNHSRTVCQRSDLRPVPVTRTTGPLLDRDGQTIGRVEVFNDDSQRVRMARCLEVQGHVAKILAGCRGLEDGIPLMLAALGEWLDCETVEFWKRHEEKESLSRFAIWAETTALRDRMTATEIQIKAHGNDWPARSSRQDQLVYEGDLGDWRRIERTPSQERLRRPLSGLAIPIFRDGLRIGVVTCAGESLDDPDELTRQALRFCADALAQFIARLRAESDLKQTEANLRQSQKMDAIGLLAGGVAHDFNNLLTIILAYGEMGLDEVDEDNPLHELFNEIHGAGQRAARMTQQLLAVSRQQPTRAEHCNLNRLIEEMDKMLQRLLGARITLSHEFDEELANIHADVNQMEQVLLNLVVNARDAMPDGGTIAITTRNITKSAEASRRSEGRRGRFVELAVTDTGCGMDEVTRSRIFEPFFTTKDVGKGTGMGLSTVFGIVKQAGGQIHVDSEVNVGTTFSVCLPQADAALVTQSVEGQMDDCPVGTETVLVVENDDSVRSLIRRLLEVRGYTVQEAIHGGDALRVLDKKSHGIDLVLTDIQMPVIDGIGLTRELKRRHPNQKLLMMSANTDPPGDIELDLTRQFLRKPFTSGELARQIRLAIGSEKG